MTQPKLAERVGVHLSQIRRYESGESQPTLDVIRKLAIALSVSADVLVFEDAERGPDDDLRLQFEALRQFTPEEKQVAKAVLESLILKHDATRFQRASTT
jgi:transcriptional regulator with XRE-family HTH domain